MARGVCASAPVLARRLRQDADVQGGAPRLPRGQQGDLRRPRRHV